MSNTDTDILEACIQGWNGQDADAVLATLAPGGTYEDPTR